MTHGAPNGGAGGAFSKATFSAEADQVGGGAVDLHDPEFWYKLMSSNPHPTADSIILTQP